MTVSEIFFFPSRSPQQNLAREELLLSSLVPGQSRLIMYVNSPCVVIGKHQNPLREVRLDELGKRGWPLLRRSSGGGTVWHDEGNLNWSYLGPRESYDKHSVSQSVIEALGAAGLSVAAGEKGDLYFQGAKVSGSAYQLLRDRVLHHGTLLCRSKLDDLHGVLGGVGQFDEWVGVASRPAPVTNLGLDVAAVTLALHQHFGPGLPLLDGGGSASWELEVSDLASRRRTRAWLWHQTPPFTWRGATRWGEGTFRVVDGLIQNAIPDDSRIDMTKTIGKEFFTAEVLDHFPTEEGI